MNGPQHVGLLRRCAAMFYDAWLVVALWLLGATADTFVRSALGVPTGTGNYFLLQIYAVIAPMLFYIWFWTHGGQTLGMRAWKLRAVMSDGTPLDGKTALVRYLAACISLGVFGLGFLWQLWDADGLTWHDRVSRSRLVRDDMA